MTKPNAPLGNKLRVPLAALVAVLMAVPIAPLAVASHGSDHPPLTTQIARGYVDTGAVPAPAALGSAIEVLGLVGDPVTAACNTIGIENPFDSWFGEGENGVLTKSKHNGQSVDPQEVLDFLQRNRGQDWNEIILKTLDICGNGFAFCVVFTPGVAGMGSRTVFCAVCCGGQTGRAPYASCNGSQYTASCGCN